MRPKRKIAIVDDSVFARKFVRVALGPGYDFLEIESLFDAPATLEREAPDLVLVDVNMPALAGNRLVEILTRSSRPTFPIVLLSDMPAAKLTALARACGASGGIPKTDDLAELRGAVERYMAEAPVPPGDGGATSSSPAGDACGHG